MARTPSAWAPEVCLLARRGLNMDEIIAAMRQRGVDLTYGQVSGVCYLAGVALPSRAKRGGPKPGYRPGAVDTEADRMADKVVELMADRRMRTLADIYLRLGVDRKLVLRAVARLVNERVLDRSYVGSESRGGGGVACYQESRGVA